MPSKQVSKKTNSNKKSQDDTPDFEEIALSDSDRALCEPLYADMVSAQVEIKRLQQEIAQGTAALNQLQGAYTAFQTTLKRVASSFDEKYGTGAATYEIDTEQWVMRKKEE